MRLRYTYMPVLLLMSFSVMANGWASSFLSSNRRTFAYAVSSDTVGGSRASSEVDADLTERQKEDFDFQDAQPR